MLTDTQYRRLSRGVRHTVCCSRGEFRETVQFLSLIVAQDYAAQRRRQGFCVRILRPRFKNVHRPSSSLTGGTSGGSLVEIDGREKEK